MNVSILPRKPESEPRVITGVRMITTYPYRSYNAQPEIVLHFHEMKPHENISLADVHSITISE